MARFAVGVQVVVKNDVCPVHVVVAIIALARPVSGGRRVANLAVCRCIMVKGNVLPAGRIVAFVATPFKMVNGCIVSVADQADGKAVMIKGHVGPVAGAVTATALPFIM